MDSMKYYRPVSNFSFLSKVREKVVVDQLNSDINSSNTSNQYQYAYRKFHSTETALLKIHNDILSSMDDGKVTALTLLDLSAAFDTILLRSFDVWFEVTGRHSTGLNRICPVDAKGLGLVTVCPPKLISNLESLIGQF